MIKLYQFTPAFGLPNASPFCMKLETYLRMAALPYDAPANANMMKSPKGKMPYIEDGAKVLGDSGLIIAYLKATYGDPLDAALSSAERAVSLAFQRLLEENLYWALSTLSRNVRFPAKQKCPVFLSCYLLQSNAIPIAGIANGAVPPRMIRCGFMAVFSSC